MPLCVCGRHRQVSEQSRQRGRYLGGGTNRPVSHLDRTEVPAPAARGATVGRSASLAPGELSAGKQRPDNCSRLWGAFSRHSTDTPSAPQGTPDPPHPHTPPLPTGGPARLQVLRHHVVHDAGEQHEAGHHHQVAEGGAEARVGVGRRAARRRTAGRLLGRLGGGLAAPRQRRLDLLSRENGIQSGSVQYITPESPGSPVQRERYTVRLSTVHNARVAWISCPERTVYSQAQYST